MPTIVFTGKTRRRLALALFAATAMAIASLTIVQAGATTYSVLLSDNFDDNLRDTSKWNIGVLTQPSSTYDPAVSVLEQNQHLEIHPRASVSGTHYNGYVSVGAFNLTNARLSVQATQVPSNGSAYAILGAGTDSNNWFRIAANTSVIYFGTRVNGNYHSVHITYNASQHAYWRIRGDSATNAVIFETSPDNASWTTRLTVKPQISLSALRAELSGGTENSISSPGMAVFDNFVLDTPGATPSPSPSPSPSPVSSPTPSPSPVSAVLLSDDFNASTRDSTKWYIGALSKTYDAAVSVQQQNGQLRITPLSGASGEHFSGYVSAAQWNLTGARAAVQLVQSSASAVGDETNFYLSIDRNNWYRFKIEAGNLYNYQCVGGTETSVTIPYNPSVHKYLRLRHNSTTDSIIWETSADNTSWTVQRTEARLLPITALNVELIAGTYQPVTTPGAALFDNFILDKVVAAPSPSPISSPTPSPSPVSSPTPSPSPVSSPGLTLLLNDDFNDNTLDSTKWGIGVLSKDPSMFDSLMPVVEQNGQLRIGLVANASGNHYSGYVTKGSWNFTASQVSVEVPQTTNGPGMYLVVGTDANNWYRIAYSSGTLLLEDLVGGARGTVTITYVAAQHRFWRIRHDQGLDQIVFETSADRSTWVAQRRIERLLKLTGMKIELGAGTYEPVATPGTAVFDNVRLESQFPTQLAWTKRNEVINDTTTTHRFSHPQPFQLDNGDLIAGFTTNEDSATYDYKLLRSTDGGNSWGSKVTIARTSNNTYEASFAQTSSTNLVCVYGDGDGVTAKRSADRGVTWGPAITIAAQGGGDDCHPSIVNAGNGQLLVAYGYNYKIMAARSSDGGATWGTATTVASTSTGGYISPSVVRMPSGLLVLAFTSGTGGTQFPNIYVTSSSDAGNTWSRPASVRAQAPYSFNDPNLAVLNNGDLVMWVVNGTESGGVRWDSFLLSHDQGLTWPSQGFMYNTGDSHRMNGIQLTNNVLLVMCASRDGGDTEYHITSLQAPLNWPTSQWPGP